MAKKFTKTESIAEVIDVKKKRINKEEIKKVENALIYGEIPLRTYEMFRNTFVGIK